MTHLMNTTDNKNYILKISIMALISFTALLSSNVALAGSSSHHGYQSSYQAGHNNYRSSVSTSYSHSQPRIKHYKAPRRVRHSSSQRRYYSRPHYRPAPVIETHSGYNSSSVRYSSGYSQNNTGAMLVGGVLGGVIANDISGGDGAVTAFGALTGAVLAGGLTH